MARPKVGRYQRARPLPLHHAFLPTLCRFSPATRAFLLHCTASVSRWPRAKVPKRQETSIVGAAAAAVSHSLGRRTKTMACVSVHFQYREKRIIYLLPYIRIWTLYIFDGLSRWSQLIQMRWLNWNFHIAWRYSEIFRKDLPLPLQKCVFKCSGFLPWFPQGPGRKWSIR